MGDTESTATKLLVLCDKRQVQTIVEEFEDWNKEEGLEVKVVLYGITQKAHDGFVLLELKKPLPEGVYINLVTDDDILDYVQYNPVEPITPRPA
jgi:hypothetical protein